MSHEIDELDTETKRDSPAASKESVITNRTFSVNEQIIESYSDANGVEICVDGFGYFENPDTGNLEKVHRYTFNTSNQMSIQMITYNATITSIKVPDIYGQIEDILLGHDELPDCIRDGRSFGAMKNFHPNKNDEFDIGNINWRPHLHKSTLILTHLQQSSRDRNAILFVCEFNVTPNNMLIVTLRTHATMPSPMNCGWMLYFNLEGHWADHIYNQIIALNIDEHITDATSIKIDKNAPENLRTAIDFGTAIARKNYHGFDDCFSIMKYNGQQKAFVGRLCDRKSGRFIEIHSTQPAVQLSIANAWPKNGDDKALNNFDSDIDGIRMRFNHLLTEQQSKFSVASDDPSISFDSIAINGKSGVKYKRHCAFALTLLQHPYIVADDDDAKNVHEQTTWYHFGLLSTI